MSQATERPITSPSRRAVLAGAAAMIPATATVAVARELAGPDPIFAAIERNRALYLRHLESARFAFDMDDGPEKEAAEALNRPDYEAWHNAASSLTTIAPTTIAGVLALIDHIAEFNRGEIFLAGDRFDWSSGSEYWPEDIAENDPSIPKDDWGVVDFGLLILRNVRNALASIEAVQS